MTTESDITAMLAVVHDDPFNETNRIVLADMLDEDGQPERAEALRRGRIPLTEVDSVAAMCLGNCRFAPATFDKRFAGDIYSRARQENPSLTPRQWLFMWLLLHRYRRSVNVERIKVLAAERYPRVMELLDLKHLKPPERWYLSRVQAWTTANLFDGVV